MPDDRPDEGPVVNDAQLGIESPLDGDTLDSDFLCDRRLLVEPCGDKYLALARLLPISAL
jgi:hypothetical protein